MGRKFRFPVLLLLMLGLLVFLLRYRLINTLQQHQISAIKPDCSLFNGRYLTDLRYQHHLIYRLRGTERLWPHRVNSLKRFLWLQRDFAGIECDIRFDSSEGKLLIAHEPESISALVLEDYLRAEPTHQKLFWLDVKNLNAKNAKLFCQQLLTQEGIYALKNRIIVESPDTAALRLVQAEGYLTSYYLPSAKSFHRTGLMPSPGNYSGIISQDAGMKEFMNENFPGRKQLIWDIRFWDGLNKEVLKKNANDTNVLVVLINVKSPGYR